ncbi:alpha/beta-hydrolase [Sistotremastrum suecicum HHB10207 ss-3]|uniref:triacylglycerol lipase n=1 Tax=Sistotremastrum suecicum HHB10207 ss-3 TaxID=1314776 RepID=A0A166DRH9_9AGAM|nr:alpha/beta-hydrolase [Sistotremastrum suecicum HHB10207 ss-3]
MLPLQLAPPSSVLKLKLPHTLILVLLILIFETSLTTASIDYENNDNPSLYSNQAQHPFTVPQPHSSSSLNPNDNAKAKPLRFRLKHIHATTSDALTILHDVPPAEKLSSLASSFSSFLAPSSPLQTQSQTVYRALSYPLHKSPLESNESPALDWTPHDVPGPNITSRLTVLELAKMAGNAYFKEGERGWYNLPPKGKWNETKFGWVAEDGGFRGHVFVTEPEPQGDEDDISDANGATSTNTSVVVISIQGPTSAPFDHFYASISDFPSNHTSDSFAFNRHTNSSANNIDSNQVHAAPYPPDKLNANLLHSCCCARISGAWRPVCDCYLGPGGGRGDGYRYKCETQCLEDALAPPPPEDEEKAEAPLFYERGVNLYNNITHLYPNSTIWIIGHSTGGSLASLLGLTFGAPVVAFEAPGEAMAAQRLHLAIPPSTQHITHFYHTADPIPTAQCTGPGSACWIGGFAFETRCHLGKSSIFDTARVLSWRLGLWNHAISALINGVLSREFPKGTWDDDPGDGDGDKGGELPVAKAEDGCNDCSEWEYV